MKFQEFKNRIKDFPLFSSSLLGYLDANEQVLRNQLTGWKRRGLLLKLKKGLYILNENDREITPSRVFLANQLYPPSYVSTEYALMFYDLIPERVVDVTSVTTRKTMSFKNAFGLFVYQHLATKSFKGFVEQSDENNHSFLIATPEKAVVDFIYFNLSRFERDKPEVFEHSFRFQNFADLNPAKMLDFALLFKNKKLFEVVKMFCEFTKESG